MVHKCMVTSIVRALHPWVEEQTPGPSGPAPHRPAFSHLRAGVAESGRRGDQGLIEAMSELPQYAGRGIQKGQ